MTGRSALVVVDLGCGDQGKGTTVDFLCRQGPVHTVVRYCGGAQAGHRVVTDDGREHVFAQFGAGTFVPGVRSFLGPEFVLQPWALCVEAEFLARVGIFDAFERTEIHEDAVVITPFHRAVNRLRERARGAARHGSCGVGVGEAVADSRRLADEDVVRVRDLFRGDLERKLRRVQDRKRAEAAALVSRLPHHESGPGEVTASHEDWAVLHDFKRVRARLDALSRFRAAANVVGDDALGQRLRHRGTVVFEGSQGVLLDEDHGFHPYTTYARCTSAGARALLTSHGFDAPVSDLGVLRAYATRHGAGPLPTEDAGLTARLPDARNGLHDWQGGFRVGYFDAVTARYAVAANGGVDALVLTCLDRWPRGLERRLAEAYVLGDGRRVRDLPQPLAGDLDHLTSLTGRVQAATPTYARLTAPGGDGEAFVRAVEGELGARVALLSQGPSARDKAWRGPPLDGRARSTRQ